MAELQYHPLANIFPLMEGQELDALVEDIREHGLREPIIITPDRTILDGRNRYRACLLSGAEPRCHITNIPESEWASYVVSLNLKRRHLTESQRATVAARLETMKHGRPGKDANLHLSRADAAEMLNVSPRTVATAKKVIEDGAEELVEAVERGDVAVSAAAELVVLPKDEQAEIVAAGPDAVREAAKEIRHHRTQFTGENEWYTPQQHLDVVRSFLGGIDLDPASNPIAQERVGAARYFTIDDDGLKQEWGGRIWLNPPYAQPHIQQFVEKLVSEYEAGRVTEAVMLTHNYTDTGWFHLAESQAARICFTRGRIRFVSPEGQLAAPTQGQAFFYFGERADEFTEAFQQFGFVR